jgi:hypothetical protein
MLCPLADQQLGHQVMRRYGRPEKEHQWRVEATQTVNGPGRALATTVGWVSIGQELVMKRRGH